MGDCSSKANSHSFWIGIVSSLAHIFPSCNVQPVPVYDWPIWIHLPDPIVTFHTRCHSTTWSYFAIATWSHLYVLKFSPMLITFIPLLYDCVKSTQSQMCIPIPNPYIFYSCVLNLILRIEPDLPAQLCWSERFSISPSMWLKSFYALGWFPWPCVA